MNKLKKIAGRILIGVWFVWAIPWGIVYAVAMWLIWLSVLVTKGPKEAREAVRGL